MLRRQTKKRLSFETENYLLVPGVLDQLVDQPIDIGANDTDSPNEQQNQQSEQTLDN